MSISSTQETPQGQMSAWFLNLHLVLLSSVPETRSRSQLVLTVKSYMLIQFIKRQFAYNSYLMCLQYIFTIDKNQSRQSIKNHHKFPDNSMVAAAGKPQ
jgi:hypothetical protein